jgi:hypothetical protein
VLVADHLGLSTARFRDPSCSGARIADLSAPQSTGSAVNPPQLASLTADTTPVTLGIGGNDLDFSGVVTRCVELDLPGILLDELRHISDDRSATTARPAARRTRPPGQTRSDRRSRQPRRSCRWPSRRYVTAPRTLASSLSDIRIPGHVCSTFARQSGRS